MTLTIIRIRTITAFRMSTRLAFPPHMKIRLPLRDLSSSPIAKSAPETAGKRSDVWKLLSGTDFGLLYQRKPKEQLPSTAPQLQLPPSPVRYETPTDWLLGAKRELDRGDLQQASDKAYMAGRKVSDDLAGKCRILLRSHRAANAFVYFVDEEQGFANKLGCLWTSVNQAHENFYQDMWVDQILREKIVPEIEQLVGLVSQIELTEEQADRFLAASDEKTKEQRLGVYMDEENFPGMRIVTDLAARNREVKRMKDRKKAMEGTH